MLLSSMCSGGDGGRGESGMGWIVVGWWPCESVNG
jgi:hypothetical protein